MTPQKILWHPNYIFGLAALFVFVSHRVDLGRLTDLIRPSPTPAVVVPAVDLNALTPALRTLFDNLRRVSRDDLDTLATFYAGLARGVAADPPEEAVLTSTGQLRRAHRAGLLFVWRGIQNNDPAKYEGLGASIEGVLTEAIGAADVPLNPTIRLSAVECFNKVAALCTSARR